MYYFRPFPQSSGDGSHTPVVLALMLSKMWLLLLYSFGW